MLVNFFLPCNPILNMVFQVLNKLKWTKKLDRAEISILHRGAKKGRLRPGKDEQGLSPVFSDRMVISGSQVKELKKGHLTYRNRVGKEVYIPLHRILEVRVGRKVLWKRKGK